MIQQGDVVLFQTVDDGEIEVVNGLVTMSGGLQTAVYISLFGGNSDDDGRKSNPLQWWGNRIEPLVENQQRSETQHALQTVIPIPVNLRKIEQAATRDLAWMKTVGAATEVSVIATLPALNQIKIDVAVNIEGVVSSFEFIENWMVDAA